ncbi:GntR family transcriptional regulator [Microbacterium luteum]|uniref:GntR family transcriptional regulator n=1 Tax=Microbacterium TaxID=33882 RepID=UPI0018873EE7|nr:GntR family transcriptional regulator [Microbacterium luteum]
MSTPLLPPRGARRVADEVYRILHARIVAGELQPGERIEIDHVARELDVSRTPVREAVLQLASTGMVERVPYRGTIVTGVDADRLEEVTALRIQLEGLAAELGAARIDEAGVARMAELQDTIEIRAHEAGYASGIFNELNAQFHGVLYAAAGAPTLVRLIEGLNAEADRMRLHFPAADGLADPHHRAIIEACRDGDVGAARIATQRHILAAYFSMSRSDAVPDGGALSLVVRETGLPLRRGC